ncbi:MAG: GUN4 domain-containing protein [Microcystaceae cyanobacterium]
MINFDGQKQQESIREAFWEMWENHFEEDDDFVEGLQKRVNEIKRNNLFDKLEGFLQQELWKEADYETTFIYYQVAALNWYNHHDKNNYYRDVADYQGFSCEELRTINNLWVKYSKGKFGFSVQRDIWLDFEGIRNYCYDYQKFAIKLEWHNPENCYQWFRDYQIQYSYDAPRGHLPITWIESLKSFIPCGPGYDQCRYLDEFLDLIKQLNLCNL